MKQTYRNLLKNMGILTISNFSSKILVFLLVPLYTSVLSTTEYGTYDLVGTTVQLFYPLLTLNIIDAVMRFSMDNSRSPESVASTAARYIGMSILLAGGVVLLWAWLDPVRQIRGLEPLVWLSFTLYVIHQFLVQFAKGTEHVLDMGIAGVLSTIASITGNILFLLCFRWGLAGFFAASFLSLFVSSAYLAFRLKIWRYLKLRAFDRGLSREMLAYCLPLIFSTLGWWVNSSSDRYVVTFLCGTAANGLLAIAYKIPTILNTLQGIFMQAWQISAIREYGGEKTAEFYGRTYSVLNLMMCLTASVLIFLTRPLASFLYAKDFYDAWQYVPFLLISSVLNSAAGFLGPILSAAKDSRSMARSAIYGAGANLVLNVVLVLVMGIQGAVIATAISSYIIFAVRRKAVGSQISIPGEWRSYAGWGLLCVQAVLSITGAGHAPELAAVLALVFLNRRGLQDLMKTFLSLAASLSRKKNR